MVTGIIPESSQLAIEYWLPLAEKIPGKKSLNEFLDRVLHTLLHVDAQGTDRLEGHDVHVRLRGDHGLAVLDGPVHDQVGTEGARDEVAPDIGGRPCRLLDPLHATEVVVGHLLEEGRLALVPLREERGCLARALPAPEPGPGDGHV